ncbi:MAG TPA: DUF2309 domain-containing protein [Urbifossiella sp.]|jgi:hypothetical protein|nr:DUF2309 domain-containing protein [Urbifossiella sp.]
MAVPVAPDEGLGGRGDAPAARLTAAIDHAAHLLPAQGPITVFIHHNTLHAFEHLRFEDAVRRGAEVFGCQPYLTEDRYRAELGRGRIPFDGLRRVLRDDLADRAEDSIVGLCTRLDLRLAMLQHPVWSGPAAELDYFLAETHALRRVRADVSAAARGRFVAEGRRWVMRDLRGRTGAGVPAWAGPLFKAFGADRIESWDDATWEAFALGALWHVCLAGAGPLPPAAPPPPSPARHRDLLVRVAGVDPDQWVNELLVRYCAAFLDQGVAHWPLPGRADGLYRCFLRTYGEPGAPPAKWLGGLAAEARRLLAGTVGPEDAARESLAALGVPPIEWDDYLSATLLALRGWGGMVREVAARGDRVGHPIPAGSLVEFVAVRLLLDRLAAAHAAKTELGYTGPLAGLRDELRARLPAERPASAVRRAFPVFQLAQVLGWAPAELSRLTRGEWALLVAEVETFTEVERRRVFHLAYEHRFRAQTLDALILHHRRLQNDEPEEPGRPRARDSSLIPHPSSFPRPRFQVVTCLDEREESFRRHLEEVAPDCETFGAAGFFNVPIYYRGATDAYFVPLCPIVLAPGHWVEERPCDGHEYAHRKQTRTRKAFGAASKGFQLGTRSAAAGAVLTAVVGPLAAVPLVARILFPRLAARVGGWFGRSVFVPPATRLRVERTPEVPPASRADGIGFTVAEMAERAARLLRDIGLVAGFSRFVFVLGHGSDSLNNPHKSAYDCGACGGSPGAPNGRALAQMLNDPRVRARVAADGIPVPEDTWFVGGYHNTCDDSVTLLDLDRVPDSHRPELARARADFDATCDRNAHERCRRFVSAPLDQTPADARRHVENRSQDLAQVRPELGHATNAICIVGRRAKTRGLFLDRRAFLTSYDPTQDDAAGGTLARLLGAAVPVCGGINLEYYFSHVDSQGYGCGTKLPHNVTALLGVMDGAASDLRTGLPWQMTEIHEPVRLLFVVETTPTVMFGIMDRLPLVGTMVRNGWVQFAVQDPHTGDVRLFKDGEFHPYTPQADDLPRAETSADWFRGWRDHLEFASIGAG